MKEGDLHRAQIGPVESDWRNFTKSAGTNWSDRRKEIFRKYKALSSIH